MSCKEFIFTCELLNGLHARPVSYLVKEANVFESDMVLENLRSGRKANLKSPLSLIAADIAYRDVCRIKIAGQDAVEAFRRIKSFVFKHLPECDELLPTVRNSGVLPPSLRALKMEFCRGQATGEGWAIGEPVCLKEYRFLPIEDRAVYAGVTGERLRLLGAIEQVQEALQKSVKNAELLAEREVLKAHLQLAGDPDFKARLLDHVDNGLSVSESIEATLEHFANALESSQSSYLRDRVIDIRDLCDQILRLSYGSGRLYSPDVLQKNSICLADNLTPSQFMGLDKSHLKGLVLECGGKASHTVLLAQARSIPVLVGVEGARELMKQADEVVLDSGLGLLIANPPVEALRYYQQEEKRSRALSVRCAPFVQGVARTSDGQRLEVGANIIGQEDAELAFKSGAEGIGLFRTEMMFMERTQAPGLAEQVATYNAVVREAEGRPVVIRTIDVGADKPVDYFNLSEEQNPFLGYRAVRLYPEFLELFKAQVEAVLKAAVHGSVGLLIPMISCVTEVRWVREVIQEVEDELRASEQQYGEIRLGIMLEVPSVCLIIDQLAQYVDFFSIGSNDLAQYFLAADRGNDKVGDLYHYLHPSFLRLLKSTVREAHRHKKWIGLCGEMASDSDILSLLVGLGLDEISLPAPLIPTVKEKVSHLNSVHCRDLLDQAVNCEDIDQVTTLLKQSHSSLAPRPVFDTAIMKLDYDCLSKEEAIKELVDMLFLDGRISDSRLLEEAVWKREAVYSTALGNGIAIPHCQSDLVYSHSAGVLRLKNPIEWNSVDGKPVDTVFLLAARESGSNNEHMKVLAELARKLVNDNFLSRIKSSPDPEALAEFLEEHLEV
ncbi:phosphoenolpyruvate--protein phosphotransferase [Endozoicomonas arenosclerae]|uniref:phosphoenolpyruvate--protein phosphotransferase n=1 Tax=Endozoicomonas arenosclerae TaxID=1633495 RepID=UPI0007827DE5|nr:phosphoenolpyruvate--protein phosphotransferase [Endozoicomonas arenosclerae]